MVSVEMVFWGLVAFSVISGFVFPELAIRIGSVSGIIRAFRLHGIVSFLGVYFAQIASRTGAVLVQREGQHYEWRRLQWADADEVDWDDVPFDRDGREEVPFVTLSDGVTQYIDATRESFARLGRRPFGMLIEDDDALWAGLEVSEPVSGKRVKADGGTYELLPERRSARDLLMYNPMPNWRGRLIDATTVARLFDGVNGPGLMFSGKKRALVDHGGEQKLSIKWLAAAAVACFLVSVVAGLLVAGVI